MTAANRKDTTPEPLGRLHRSAGGDPSRHDGRTWRRGPDAGRAEGQKHQGEGEVGNPEPRAAPVAGQVDAVRGQETVEHDRHLADRDVASDAQAGAQAEGEVRSPVRGAAEEPPGPEGERVGPQVGAPVAGG